jgi:PEP-CTERM motif
MKMKFLLMAMLSISLLILSTPAAADTIIFSASGPNEAAIQGTVDAFRTTLGDLNPNVAGSFGSGRREINWDGVPDAFSAPNNLPANFFNVNSPRGAVFATPGTGFQVSADAVNPTATPIQFGNIDPTYPGLFATFSPERLFTALGSTVTDVNFFIPGSSAPATVSGFGAVFTDVDLANTTSIQFFGPGGASLDTFLVPPASVNETLSFLGVFFGDEIVSMVRITSGNAALAPGVLESGPLDLVVMDDFIYGEPVPLPGTFLLMGTGLAGFWLRRRFAKK